MSEGVPRAPSHLSVMAKKWFSQIAREYDLGTHHALLLAEAAASWDRCQQARLALATHGLTSIDDKGTERARPEVAIEKDSRASFAKLLRQLELDGVEVPVEEPVVLRPDVRRVYNTSAERQRAYRERST